MGWFRNLISPPADELGDLRAATAAFVRRALEADMADDGLQLTMHGCKLRGVPVGDWEFTVRRLPTPKAP